MIFDEALLKLKERFPNGDINQTPTGGDVHITVPLRNGETYRPVLTWQQARYVATSTMTGDDLFEERFPEDWPK
jgi:hypothetical protein